MDYIRHGLIYENPLACSTDVSDFFLEGSAAISFENGRMRMQNRMDPAQGQKANFVYWCPQCFEDRIEISWDFYPVREPGLCVFFFAAMGKNGLPLFDKDRPCRSGEYQQYHHGDMDALHVSYFRRKFPEERAFHVCNLRKSYGFFMTAQGADPLPSVEDASPPYRIRVLKYEEDVRFFINDLEIFRWSDDAKTYGPILRNGWIGFRQMAPLVAEYADLKIYSLRRD